ncbi:hypothetical protein TNCV_2908321 [Trichonephila clavipes]|nr:hypothetical protein TNCV_2908321 [Trichonephila clavipes]
MYVMPLWGHCSLVVKVTDSWLACHEFEPELNLLRLKRPPVGMEVRRGDVRSQVSSSSFDQGSKSRGPVPKALCN